MKSDQISAFRLSQNFLMKPLPLSQLVVGASAGLQNSTPGAVALSLAARIKNFSLGVLDEALFKKKSLVEITGIRGASYIVPSKDFSVFTQATFPTSEKELLSFIGTKWDFIKNKQFTATQAVKKITDVTVKVLDLKSLTQDEIHAEWRKKLPKELLSFCRGCDSFHVPYPVVMAMGLQGTFCFGNVKDGITSYVRADQWLTTKDINTDLETIRRELVKRFLRFYGPGTVSGFATWSGVSSKEAKEFWRLVEDDITEVDGLEKPAFVLKKDLADLRSASLPKGVALLPPHDAYLNLPDRETLVSDKKLQSKVWKILGNPSVFLIGGKVTGIFRSTKKGSCLSYQFEAFSTISGAEKKSVEAEAERLAEFKECRQVEVKW